jgi:hypothetical protein
MKNKVTLFVESCSKSQHNCTIVIKSFEFENEKNTGYNWDENKNLFRETFYEDYDIVFNSDFLLHYRSAESAKKYVEKKYKTEIKNWIKSFEKQYKITNKRKITNEIFDSYSSYLFNGIDDDFDNRKQK